jgi:hypothetical protein
MKLVFSFLCLISFNAYTCELKAGSYALLSGGITKLIKEIGLENSKKIKLYSNFFPIKSKTAKLVTGGIFISPKVIDEANVETVFFDSGEELRKSLRKSAAKSLIAYHTNGLDPFEAYALAKEVLTPFLKNCEKKISALDARVEGIKELKLKRQKIVFFVGEITQFKKLPELVMSNDGLVKFLKDKKELKSYPSELSYVTWSSKILEKLKAENYLLLGLVSSETEDFKVEKIEEGYINIHSRLALIPGLSQIFFLEKLMQASF